MEKLIFSASSLVSHGAYLVLNKHFLFVSMLKTVVL